MKIKDIIQESAFDLIAHYHAVPEHSFDHNPEADHFASINAERYQDYFKEFYVSGTVPIFSTEVEGECENPMTNKPKEDQPSSAGHRGMELLKNRTNANHSKARNILDARSSS